MRAAMPAARDARRGGGGRSAERGGGGRTDGDGEPERTRTNGEPMRTIEQVSAMQAWSREARGRSRIAPIHLCSRAGRPPPASRLSTPGLRVRAPGQIQGGHRAVPDSTLMTS